jgi:hypothetical protein
MMDESRLGRGEGLGYGLVVCWIVVGLWTKKLSLEEEEEAEAESKKGPAVDISVYLPHRY